MRAWRYGALVVLITGLLAASLTPADAAVPPTPAPSPPPTTRADDRAPAPVEVGKAEAVGPGVTHREITATEGGGTIVGDVVEVDLAQPGVHMDLLSPGKVASTADVKTMADAAGAVAGINGDFFDISATGAPAGPAVRGGKAVKAAVPQGRRAAPAVPGAEMDYVYAIGVDGIGRIDRLPLNGEVSGPHGTVPIVALNQFAVPVGGVGVFTSAWGRDRSQTLCGTDDNPKAGCAANRWEIVVRKGVVTEVGSTGSRALAADETALDGRDQGAVALRQYKVGDPADIEYELTPRSGVAPQVAVGGQPILVDGKPTERLDNRIRAPRSAVGNSKDGRHIFLVTVDGRQTASAGATLSEMSALLAEQGIDDAVNLDGGGSSTLVYKTAGATATAIVSDPSGTTARRVGDGLGVFTS